MKLFDQRIATLAFLLPNLLNAAFPAITTAQEAPPADVFGETIEVRVVNVEVVVTDKQGIPVRGLDPGDFTLRVDGEEIPVDYFTEIRGGVASEPGEAGEREELGPGGFPSLTPGKPVSTSYLIFIDDYFSIARDRNRVLDRLSDQLPLLGLEDRMAVVAFDGRRVEMLTSWSQSRSALRRALEEAKERRAYGLHRISELRTFESTRLQIGSGAVGTPRAVASSERRAFELTPEERVYAEQLGTQVERSALAATAALRGFASPPGRKVMLLLAGGWPLSVADYVVNDATAPIFEGGIATPAEALRPLTETANLLGYTIYPVDVPGLGGDPRIAASEATLPRTGTFFNHRETNVEDSLQFIAAETGGRALINGGREEAFETAVEDTRSYYWLGFNSQRRGDEADHEIEVKINVPGMKARTRKGFQDLSGSTELDLLVESTLLFGDSPGLSNLPVELGETRRSGRKYIEVPIKLRIPVESLTLLPSGSRFVGRLELRIAAINEKGDRSEIPVIPLAVTLEEKPAEGSLITYETRVKLRRQKQDMVMALYDTVGGVVLTRTLELSP